MKQLLSLFGACLLFMVSAAQTIQVTTDQTTSLIFPFPIQHVDRGSSSILVQTVPEASHILLVKAAVKDFAATNLTIITKDGSTYALSVTYVRSPMQWVYPLETKKEISLEGYAHQILDNPRTTHGMQAHSWDMHARVSGIYVKGATIFYQLQLVNNSPVDYDLDFLRVFIRHARKGKRTARQENEMIPLFIAGNIRQVKAHQQQQIVLALDKYMLPPGQFMAIQIMEQQGGRHLLLKVNNRKIARAIPLSDWN